MSGRPRGALLVAAVLASIILPSGVAADHPRHDLEEVTARIAEVAGQIDDVTAERSDLAARIRAAGGKLDLLLEDLAVSELELGRLQRQISEGEARLNSLREVLGEAYVSLSVTRTEIASTRQDAARSARDAYMRGRRDLTTLAFSANQVTEFSVGLAYLDRVAVHHGGAVSDLLALELAAGEQEAAVRDQETTVRAELVVTEALQLDATSVRDQLDADRRELELAIGGLEALFEELDAELSLFESELDVLADEQRDIKAKIAADQAKRRSARQAAPAVSAVGFVRPVPGHITSGFGPRVHPILGHTRAHTGVDMSAPHGQPIKAASEGTVTLAATWGGYGRVVVIDHGDGLSTLYAHLSAIKVSKGDSVEPGQSIGKVGASGLATGAHLHFEVRFGGDPIDPVPYLRG